MNTDFASKINKTVYFDGICYLCSFEISHYRKMRGAQTIRFLDITSAEFNAALENVDPYKIHESLHVKDAQGVLYTGVDAFIEIWKEIPALNKWAKVAQINSVKSVLNVFYKGFAKVRPHLPRKSCEESPYCMK